jgi:hypothetical protein
MPKPALAAPAIASSLDSSVKLGGAGVSAAAMRSSNVTAVGGSKPLTLAKNFGLDAENNF